MMLPQVARTTLAAGADSKTRTESKQKLTGSKGKLWQRTVTCSSKASCVSGGPQQEASASSAGAAPARLMTPVASCVGVAGMPMSPPLRASVWWTDDPDARQDKQSCLSLWQAEQEEADVQDMPSLPLISPAASARPQEAEQAVDGEGQQGEEQELLAAAAGKYRLVGDATVAELQVLLEWPGRGMYGGSLPKVLQAVRVAPEDKEQVKLPPGLRGARQSIARQSIARPSMALDRAAVGRMVPGLRRLPSPPEEAAATSSSGPRWHEGAGMSSSGTRWHEGTGMSSSGTRWHVGRKPTLDARGGLSPKGRRKRRDDCTGDRAIAISRRESDLRRQWMLEDPDYMSWRISELKDANVRARVASSSPGEDAAPGALDRSAWAPPQLLPGGAAAPGPARRRAQGSAPPSTPATAPGRPALAALQAQKKGGDHVAEARQLAQSMEISSKKLRAAQRGEEERRNSFSATVASAFHFHTSKAGFGKPAERTSDASAGSAARLPGRREA
ncbi:unnamed protein product [Prorocentrum cordatum]|uniref:Uncharacterized protein n=1 Tax=Prorocentrum cordatum TaxID=2364126 RepID=A0ABN9ST01_9DINO|nr:unnamed protein product [Polarella glacialis]